MHPILQKISLLLLLGPMAVTSAMAADVPRPNILFAFADDWGRYAGVYAKIDGPGTISDVVKTPNFDRIANEGVLFRSAFVSAPSCTPCRSALLSGQHFWRTGRGAILQGAVWDGSQPAYPLLLKDAGYHIGETYKVWSPGTPNDAPFGAGKYAYEKAGGRFNQFSTNVTKMIGEGIDLESAKNALYAEVEKNFDRFLADRKKDQPFCYWFGPTNVHRKWMKGSGKKLWNIDPDLLKGKLPGFLPDVPEVREDLADYFGEIAAYDAALGLLIKKLESIGELDNTLVVVSGDHGAPGFPHGKCNLYDFGSSVSLAVRWGKVAGGRVVDDLISLTDLAPTFLELGNVSIPERMTGRSLVALLQSGKAGRVEPVRDAVFIGRERHVENARAEYTPYPQRAIRTHDYLYIINFHPERWPLGDPYRLDDNNPPTANEITEVTRATLPDEDAGPSKAWLVGVRKDAAWKAHFEWVYGKRPREELYDLKKDPMQLSNVAADASYDAVRKGLEKRLIAELTTTGDPRLIDNGKFFETPPMAGPVTNDDQGGSPKKAKQAKGKKNETADASSDRDLKQQPVVSQTTQRPPDIFVFLTDDQSQLDCTPYGGSGIRTPNMQRLADSGMTFERAYVASPSCAPSRAALLTGLMPAQNGAEANHSKPRAEIKKWPAYFQELGYEVVSFGKISHYKHTADYGFDHFANDGFHDHASISSAVEFLKSRKSRNSKPICLMVGSNWPHVPWPETELSYDPAKLPLPAGNIDTPETRAWRARYATAVTKADDDLGRVLDAVRTDLSNDTLVLFSADHGAQWPFSKWNLYESGVCIPLIVSWPGVVTPGSRSKAMVSWTDFLPTLIEAAKGAAPTTIEGRSFLNVLKGESTSHRERVFTTHANDNRMNVYPSRAVRDERWKYIRNLHPEYAFTTHIDLVSGRLGQRAFFSTWEAKAATSSEAAAIVKRYHERPAEELYDLDNDPHEQVNLALKSRHSADLTRLREELDRWITLQGDQQKTFAEPRLLSDPKSFGPAAAVEK
jgi:N-sulfoglucosamine sulfohydrolase